MANAMAAAVMSAAWVRSARLQAPRVVKGTASSSPAAYPVGAKVEANDMARMRDPSCSVAMMTQGRATQDVYKRQKYWKAFYGFCAAELGGKICRRNFPRLRPAGEGCGIGKSKRFG